MGLTQRKARPLNRDVASFRDTRLFIVACDDTYAPKQYFDFFSVSRIQVHVIETQDGTSSAQYVLRRLVEIEHADDDELWLLLDTDHCTQGTHLQTFTQALKEAREKGVNVALSKPCFELWLLLHHEDEGVVGELKNAEEAEGALRLKLGAYNKRSLKKEHYPLARVRDAVLRAEKLDNTVAGGDIPQGNTSRVYQLWKAILAKTTPSQLPPELINLIPRS